jgi:transcriptional regulator with XRE-family HTH domain
VELGEKIRALRRLKKMGLEELSRLSGVSKGLLSLIERSISAPTVRTLEKIAKPLGTTVSILCYEEEEKPGSAEPQKGVLVVRKSDRKKLVMGPERGKARYELLTPDYQRKIQFIYMHFPVGKKSGRLVSHEGDECGLVVEGRLKVQIQDQEFILQEGDSIYFDSTLPHILENVGEIEVRAFWVNTPPTF